jgi:hypothetical protein
MPTQLRRLVRQRGRDLHAEFLQLLPHRLPPVPIQRWTLRRVGLIAVTAVGVALAAAFAIGQITGSPL